MDARVLLWVAAYIAASNSTDVRHANLKLLSSLYFYVCTPLINRGASTQQPLLAGWPGVLQLLHSPTRLVHLLLPSVLVQEACSYLDGRQQDCLTSMKAVLCFRSALQASRVLQSLQQQAASVSRFGPAQHQHQQQQPQQQHKQGTAQRPGLSS